MLVSGIRFLLLPFCTLLLFSNLSVNQKADLYRLYC